MKRENESANAKRNFENLVSKLDKEAILDVKEMYHVRGGDGEGNDPIILPPPPGGN